MKARHLIALPLGEYELTDGIYTYTLYKTMTTASKELGIESRPIYSLYQKGSSAFSQHITMFEDKEDVWKDCDDRDRWRKGKYFRPILNGMSGVGGINVHGQVGYLTLSPLEFGSRRTPTTNNTIN